MNKIVTYLYLKLFIFSLKILPEEINTTTLQPFFNYVSVNWRNLFLIWDLSDIHSTYAVSCILCAVFCILCPLSILYPISCVLYPGSCILFDVFCILCPLSILYPISCLFSTMLHEMCWSWTPHWVTWLDSTMDYIDSTFLPARIMQLLD